MRGLRSGHRKESKPSDAEPCAARQSAAAQCNAPEGNAGHCQGLHSISKPWKGMPSVGGAKHPPEHQKKGTVHHNNVAPLFSTLWPPIDTPRKPPWTPRFNIGGFREAWKTRGLTQQCCAAGGLSMASCSSILKQGGAGGIGCAGLRQRLGPYCLLDRWRNIFVINR